MLANSLAHFLAAECCKREKIYYTKTEKNRKAFLHRKTRKRRDAVVSNAYVFFTVRFLSFKDAIPPRLHPHRHNIHLVWSGLLP
mgnify:FL=1